MLTMMELTAVTALKATKVSKNEETMTVEYAYHLYHF